MMASSNPLKPQLCTCCQRIFSAPPLPSTYENTNSLRYYPSPHHETGYSFLHAIGNGCQLCAQIQETLTRYTLIGAVSWTGTGPVPVESICYEFRRKRPSPTSSDDPVLTIYVRITEEVEDRWKRRSNSPGHEIDFGILLLAPEEVEPDTQLPQETSSLQTFQQAAKWISGCSKNHDSCQHGPAASSSRCLPSRLVEIQNSDSNIACLRLASELPVSTPYLTLSHCWGDGPHFKLLSSNIDALRQGIEVPALPATFQDSLTTTKALGLSHIWIDSLCIIQDSANDWIAESVLMDQVYKFAECNLAATSGARSDHGLFTKRDPKIVQPLRVSLDFEVSSISLPQGEYRLLRTTEYDHDVPCGPLNSRAWVMQEKVLSQRVLHFTNRQIYFECSQGILFESLPNGPWQQNSRAVVGLIDIFYQRKALGWSQDLPGPINPLVLWHKIIGIYCGCKLTMRDDKMIALAGLAKEFSLQTGWTYVAGLWKEYLPIQLLWTTLPNGRGPNKLPGYRAPSWSWASCEGYIYPLLVSDSKVVIDDASLGTNFCLDILDVQISTSSEDKMSQVTGGSLKLSGHLHPAKWDQKKSHLYTAKWDEKTSEFILGSDEWIHTTASFDDENYEPPEDLWCVPVYRGHTYVFSFSPELQYLLHGLMLRRAQETDENLFYRIGYYSTSSMETWPTSLETNITGGKTPGKQVITII